MPACPNCATPLNTVRQREGLFYLCPACNGRAVTIPQVRRVAGDRFATSLLRQINTNQHFGERSCPFCCQRMRNFISQNPPLELDACKRCGAVWFDPQEFETVPEGAVESPHELQMRAAEALGLYKLEQLKKRGLNDEEPDATWKTVPALFGLPVETDTPGLSRYPWATWSVSALIIIVSVWAWTGIDQWLERFGLIPAEAGRYSGATLVTSFFLHAGAWHLVGNIYFLLIFGDNVEDYLGRWRWLALLALASIGGDLLHLLVDTHSTQPCVGASGGISGIIAFYALEFPQARLSFLYRSYRYPGFYGYSGWGGINWISLPAWGAFVLWLLIQFLLIAEQLAGFGHVSAAAHLGGALVGFIAWLIWRKLGNKARV